MGDNISKHCMLHYDSWHLTHQNISKQKCQAVSMSFPYSQVLKRASECIIWSIKFQNFLGDDPQTPHDKRLQYKSLRQTDFPKFSGFLVMNKKFTHPDIQFSNFGITKLSYTYSGRGTRDRSTHFSTFFFFLKSWLNSCIHLIFTTSDLKTLN